VINKVIVVGRLGKDPELQYIASGAAVTKFSVAADSGFGDKKKTEWFNVVAWEKTAEACAQYLTKGSLVYVEGRQQTDTWEKDGVKQYRTMLVAERVQFLDTKGARDDVRGAATGKDAEGDIDPDSLPF